MPLLLMESDNGGGPFWNERGNVIAIENLGLPDDLREWIETWTDRSWESDELHRAGRPIYDAVTKHLAGQYDVVWED